MKVALVGASGQAGTRILAELVRRGHQVTAIARHPEKIPSGPGVTARQGDVFDKEGLVALINGATQWSARFISPKATRSS